MPRAFAFTIRCISARLQRIVVRGGIRAPFDTIHYQCQVAIPRKCYRQARCIAMLRANCRGRATLHYFARSA
eukprot:8103542-Lingulodinium_polyedra.AAC.1